MQASPEPATEDTYQVLIDLLPYALLVHQDGKIVYANPAAVAMAGVQDASALVGRDVLILSHPDTRAVAAERIRRVIEEGVPGAAIEEKLQRPDGTEFLAVVAAIPFTLGGRPAVLATAADITAQKRAERALRESEERYRRLFDQVTEGIAVADLETGEITDCNQAFLDLTGYSREELIGRHQGVLDPASTGETAVSPGFARSRSQEGQLSEGMLRTRAGGRIHVEIRSKSIEIGGRKLLQGVFRDVSEMRRARRIMETSLSLMRLLNEATDTRGLVRELIPLIQDVVGCAAVGVRLREGADYPFYETKGFPATFVESERFLCRDAAGVATPGEGRLECMCGRILEGRVDPSLPFFTAAGSFWTNSTTELARMATPAEIGPTRGRCAQYESVALVPMVHRGEVLGLMQCNDPAPGRFRPGLLQFLEFAAQQVAISLAHRQSQEALAASEAKLRRLADALNQTTDAVVITNRSAQVEYLNRAAERAWGYSGDELAGGPDLVLRGLLSTLQQNEILEATGHNLPWSGRLETRRRDGTKLLQDCTVTPVQNVDGQYDRIVAVARDVSREAALEEQVRQTQRLESVGRLAAGVAHDLNNLLIPILGYADLVMADVGPEDQHYEGIRQIVNAAERCRELLVQLLAFAKRQELETKPTDVRTLVEQMARLVHRILRENIRLDLQLSGEPCVANVDTGQIGQVLMNLAVNAQDAMARGGVLRIRVERKDVQAPLGRRVPPGRYILLSVSDTGCGMDRETQSKMFEPFFTTKGAAGTGMGLATVYGIVEQHGGAIDVVSEPGRGTEIDVYLPHVSGPAGDAAAPSAVEPVRGGERILVVEDNDAARRMTVRILERQGYRVVSARDGRDALALLEHDDIDLLLTDVIMPHVGGPELAQAVLQQHPRLKVLLMSGYTGDALRTSDERFVSMPLLQKPFGVQELARAVRHVLDGTGGPA